MSCKKTFHFLYGKKWTFDFTDRNWHIKKNIKSSIRNQISDHHRHAVSLQTATHIAVGTNKHQP